MILVLNEWVFHELLGEHGPDKFSQTKKLLISFRARSDRLVIPAEGRWQRKFYRVMDELKPRSEDQALYEHWKRFYLDSNSGVHIYTKPLPDFAEKYPQVPEEDLYLVFTYIAADADALVTTDQELCDSLVDETDINCRMRDDFIKEYLDV